MMRAFTICAAAGLILGNGAPPPVPGGTLGTLDLGSYACEVPSPEDATRGRAIEGGEFSVVNSSSYRVGGALGSYLRTGDEVVFTSGPKEGERFRRVATGTLRVLTRDGVETRARCLLIGARKQ